MLENLDVKRESLLDIFFALRQEVNNLYGETVEELATACDGLGFNKMQFIFALNVFVELGFVSFDEGSLTIYRGVKAELTDSAVYRLVCGLQSN